MIAWVAMGTNNIVVVASLGLIPIVHEPAIT